MRPPRDLGGFLALSLFLGVFFFGGLLGFYLITARPIYRWFEAGRWTEVPCTVASATRKVITQSDDPDTIEYTVHFKYVYAGTRYGADRYGLGALRGGMNEEAFERLAPGAQTVCYVDPGDPSVAVLNRDLPGGWGFGVFPLMATAAATFFWVVLLRAHLSG